MLKTLVRMLSFPILACGAQFAYASPVWMNGVTIKTIYPYADGSFVLTFSSSSAACPSAQTPDKYFYVTINTTPNGNTITQDYSKNLLAVSLQAMALGKQVDVLFDSATSNCFVGALVLHT